MKKRIMVVDDNPDVISSVKEGIAAIDKNYDIVGVESGEKCIQLLTENLIPDLILLDIMMPGMSGWKVYERLKEVDEWKNIPVVFLTARTDDSARRIGEFLGDDYVEKPFDVKELKDRIDRILKK